MEIRLSDYHPYVKALKEERKLLALVCPYGTDAHGKRFSEKTKFYCDIGDSRPVMFYHGHTPDGKPSQDPELIGKATIARRDGEGLWAEIVLNASALATRIWEAAKRQIVKASSGAIDYLYRDKNNEILSWVLGEISLLDTSPTRQPANQRAVVNLKAYFDECAIDFPETFSEANSRADVTTVEANLNAKGIEMEKQDVLDILAEAKALEAAEAEKAAALKAAEDVKKVTNLKTEGIEMDLNEFLALQAEAAKLETDAEAKKAADLKLAKDAEDAENAKMAAFKKSIVDELMADPKHKALFNVKSKTKMGFGDDELARSWLHYLATADNVVAKANFKVGEIMEGTDAGYFVPPELLPGIEEIRDEASILRSAGVEVIPTSANQVLLNIEDTQMTEFVQTDEGTSYDEEEPVFDQIPIDVYKWTKTVKISEEMFEDDPSVVMPYVQRKLGVLWGKTEDKFGLVGAGTTEPEGIFAITPNYTFAGEDAITPEEIAEIYYTLPRSYRQNATWLMNDSTESYLRTLRDDNSWIFSGFGASAGPLGLDSFAGKRIFCSPYIDAIDTAAVVMAFFDPQSYKLVARRGLAVLSDPYTFRGNGFIGLYASFRSGGAPVYASTAFVVADMFAGA